MKFTARAIAISALFLMCTSLGRAHAAQKEVRLRIAECMTSHGVSLFVMQFEDAFTEAGGARPLWHTIEADIEEAAHEAIAWDIVITSNKTLSDKLRRSGASRAEELLCSDPILLIGPKRSFGKTIDEVMRGAAEGDVVFISCFNDESLQSAESLLWERIGAADADKKQNYVESSRTGADVIITAEEEDAVALVAASSFAQYAESMGGEVPLAVIGDTGERIDTVACFMSTDGFSTQRTEAADRFLDWLRQGGASDLAEKFELGGDRPFATR